MTNDQIKEVKMAWARGEVVQYKNEGGLWSDWGYDNELVLVLPCTEWRVKPKIELPEMEGGWDSPDGKLWGDIDKWFHSAAGSDAGVAATAIENTIREIAERYAIKTAELHAKSFTGGSSHG